MDIRKKGNVSSDNSEPILMRWLNIEEKEHLANFTIILLTSVMANYRLTPCLCDVTETRG